MRIYLFLIAVYVMMMTACSSPDEKARGPFVELNDTVTISTEIGLPLSISLHRGKLFVSDFYGEDGFVKILNLETGNIENGLACKGDGPNNLLSIGNVDCISSENIDFLYVFDPMAKRIQQYNMDSLLSVPYSKPMNTIELPADSRYSEIMRTSTGYIASGLMESKKFVLLDDSLHECGHGGRYASKPSSEVPDMLNVVANNGKFALSKDRRYIINIIYMAGIITCYTLDDASHTISQKWERKLSGFDYEVRGDAFYNKEVMGYQDISVGSKFIYALYSGEKEDLNVPATYGQEIHVYDYDGNLIRLYKLSLPAFCICVDESQHVLYVATHESQTAIIRYTLPTDL